MHPYRDFNARFFGVLLLNKELLKNELEPSLLVDVNSMDYLSKERFV